MPAFELGKRLDEVLALSNPHVFPASTHAAAKMHIFGAISSIYTHTTAARRTGFPAYNCARVVELVSELDGVVATGKNALFACRDIPFSDVPQPIVAPPGRAYDATRDGLLIFRITKGSRVALHAAMLLPRDGAEIFGSLIWQAIGATPSGLVPTTARVSTPSGTPPGLGMPGTCATCGTAERAGGARMLRCSRCQVSFYCSPECQRNHWRAHKTICNAMAAAASRARWHQAVP